MNNKPSLASRPRALARALVVVAVVSLSAVLPVNVPRAESNNLLQNGSMETFHTYATDPGTGEPLTLATGWNIFVESGSPYYMSSVQFATSPWGTGHIEYYEGNDLQMIFTPNGPEPFVAGMYQQVHGLTPGVAYAFSGRFTAVSNGVLVGRKMGWDPYGGTDPLSPDVIWGVEEWATETWRNIYMAEMARTSTATVFIRIDHAAPTSAGNSETFLDAFVLDVAPLAHMTALASTQASSPFYLNWAVDWVPPGTWLDRYQAEFRDGAGGWSRLALGTNFDTAYSFSGQDCHTYNFRARAVAMHEMLVRPDGGFPVGSRIPSYWPPEGQVTTTIITTPPSSSVGGLPAYQPDRFTVSWTGSPGSCGVAGYDVQVRDGPSGVWSDWLQGTSATSSSFTGQDGHAYAFRSRAAGVGGYYEPYPSSADAATIVDALAPTVTIGALPLVEVTTTIPLTWTAVDTASGVASYDVQTRSLRLADGLDSGWRPWISATVATQAQFTATDNTRFSFRVTARDAVGNASSSTAGTNVLLAPAPVLVTSDLAASTLLPHPTEPVTFTVSVSNTGNLSATAGLVLSLPLGIGNVISASVTASRGAPAWDGVTVTWNNPLEAGAGVVVTATLHVSDTTPLGTRASAQAVIIDGVHLPITRTLALLLPYQVYLPVALRQ